MKYNFASGLLLSFDGHEWTVEGGGQSFQLKLPEDFWRVISLLEISFDQAEQALGADFKYSSVILAGLNSGSDYWVDLALLWAEKSGLYANADVSRKLSELISLDQLSQSARSKARALVSRQK